MRHTLFSELVVSEDSGLINILENLFHLKISSQQIVEMGLNKGSQSPRAQSCCTGPVGSQVPEISVKSPPLVPISTHPLVYPKKSILFSIHWEIHAASLNLLVT